MSKLIFIFLAATTPLLSIAVGSFLFPRLPYGMVVMLTIVVFSLLLYGVHYLSAQWQKKVRAPAKAAEYEASLLAPAADGRGVRGLDQAYVFSLGIWGHLASMLAIAGLVLIPIGKTTALVLLGRGLIVAMLLGLLMRMSRMSPFFVSPLIATRAGIRTQKYFIPWRDVVNVQIPTRATLSRFQSTLPYVETTRGISAYRIGGDGRAMPHEAKRIRLLTLGMWKTDAVQYLQLRARLSGADKLADGQPIGIYG